MSADNKVKFLRDAEKFVLQGKTQQAIIEYLKIIKNDPHDVLTLNIIGDLYLRLGKKEEANRVFREVAESYFGNNFFLKAIAVYKKILSTDPENLEICQTLASLFTKQGLTVDARNQYLHISEIHAREGRKRESLEACEKVVALDPTNIKIQLQLAETYLAEGGKEKAKSYFAGAGHAQARSGNFAAAIQSLKQALSLDPGDVTVVLEFVECCQKAADTQLAIEHLNRALAIMPDNVSLLEALGRCLLEIGELDNAEATLRHLLALDETRYSEYFVLAKALIGRGHYDRAVTCLDSIQSILISRRDTDRATEICDLVLATDSENVSALTQLAAIYSATNDQARCLDLFDRLAGKFTLLGEPKKVVEALEKILQMMPLSEKHLKLHRQAFAEAFPGLPYQAPGEAAKALKEIQAVEEVAREGTGKSEGDGPTTVEIDLLLNYGMREKALSLLRTLESQDPCNLEVRSRLLSVFKEDGENDMAAEQCLLMAAVNRKNDDDEAARKYLAEAKKLSPGLMDSVADLCEFAGQHGIEIPQPPVALPSRSGYNSYAPLDLSGDLSDMFLKEIENAGSLSEEHLNVNPEPGEEDFTFAYPAKMGDTSLTEQLQEVDFYLRLGFQDEARIKLDEIAKNNPDNAEITSRYRQLEGHAAQSAPLAEVVGAGESGSDTESGHEHPEVSSLLDQSMADMPYFPLSEDSKNTEAIDATFWSPEENVPDASMAAGLQTGSDETDLKPSGLNVMFADLLDEVNSLTEPGVAREDFETHFSLGIAYHEMSLTDEAVREFQSAVKTLDPAKAPRDVIRCCGMLSTCFLVKGMANSAIRWCKAGLSVPDVSQHEALAFRYDMGVAHSLAGDRQSALDCFSHIFEMDSGYRDVAHRIDELKTGPENIGLSDAKP